jgi:hypothetical protein
MPKRHQIRKMLNTIFTINVKFVLEMIPPKTLTFTELNSIVYKKLAKKVPNNF